MYFNMKHYMFGRALTNVRLNKEGGGTVGGCVLKTGNERFFTQDYKSDKLDCYYY